MAFCDFKYPDLLTTFGITERTVPTQFADVPLVAPSAILTGSLAVNLPLATGAHSESA